MSIVYKSDLVSANNLASISQLESEINSSESLKAAIMDFISSSEYSLKGKVWDFERKKLQSFVNILNIRTKILSDIMDSIKKANNNFINFMADYDVIDDSKLNDLLAEKNLINSIISSIESNEEQGLGLNFNFLNTDTILNNIKLLSITKEINKINELKNADISSNNLLNDSFSSINDYKNSINDI